MSKPLNDNLKAVRIETESGDLLPVMEAAGEKLAELINAVTAYEKAGTLTMKISVKPSTAGALAVKAEVTITKPKGMPTEALLWPTPEGNLLSEDPSQLRFDLKTVSEPERNLKQVS